MIKFLLIFCFTATTYAAEYGKFLGDKHIENMPAWFKNSFLDLADDVEEATEGDKHLILYFHQDGCPYCAKLIEENFTNLALVKKLQKSFEVIEVNIWGDRELIDIDGGKFSEKQYAEFLKVQFTPSLFFLDEEGQLILRLDGYHSTQRMQKILDFVSNKHYKNTHFADFIANKNLAGRLNSQSFFEKAPHILSRSEQYQSSKFLAVLFEEKSCVECDNFHKNMLSQESIRQALTKMDVVQLNISTDEKIITPSGQKTTSKLWYRDLKLTYTPAIVFFDKAGIEIIRKDAFFKAFHLESIIDYVLSKQYKTQSNFQRFIESRADKIRKTGKDVNLWK